MMMSGPPPTLAATRGLRSDVIPAFGVDAYFDAGLLDELLGVDDKTGPNSDWMNCFQRSTRS